jgi:ATP-dependent protease HslVU (ClpYQ) peptidase subunit
MTVIAWDGRTLAADKQSTAGSMRRTATKIHRVTDGLVALSGDASHAHAVLAWFQGVRDPREFPLGAHPDTVGHVIYFTQDGVFLYDGMGTGHREKIEDSFIAFGSGRDYAMAAMHLGCDARRAVEVACEFDVYCGMGVDVLELEQ